ncbi:MAG: amino acid-binding protein [Verrucomicrobiae bacterium]|nr:amino acid-binding protein [Verrucomicrobiae bacterium]MCX7721441.1 amino acid-binding protein [Verrucomicrobiae bacterium]
MKAQKIEVWTATIEDKPGALASKLKPLADAKANLECVVARREPDKPGQGVVFIAPVKGKKATAAAESAGFKKADGMVVVRIEGGDKPGLGARLAGALAEKGLNLRELTAAAIGKKFVCYVALDTEADAATAIKVLKALK